MYISMQYPSMKKKLIQLTPQMVAWLKAKSQSVGMPENVLIRMIILERMRDDRHT